MKKNLYIADWKPGEELEGNCVIYTITPEALARAEKLDFKPEAPDEYPILSPLFSLIERNVTFAAVPETQGEGSACYLINLTSLTSSSEGEA